MTTPHSTLLITLATFALAGCSLPAVDEHVAGPYRLIATDESSLTTLDICNDDVCAGDGLPDPTVFAAGADAKYVVFAQHPASKPRGSGVDAVGSADDRSVTNYYYIIRVPDEARGIRKSNLIGPMDKKAFDEAKARMRLPGFSITLDDLK